MTYSIGSDFPINFLILQYLGDFIQIILQSSVVVNLEINNKYKQKVLSNLTSHEIIRRVIILKFYMYIAHVSTKTRYPRHGVYKLSER